MVAGASSTRPIWVTVTEILAVFIGILGMFGGAILIPGAGPILLGLSISAVVIGAMYLTAGYGLLKRRSWALPLGIVVSVFAIVRNLAEAALGSLAFSIPGLVVAAIIVFSLTRASTKAFVQGQNSISR